MVPTPSNPANSGNPIADSAGKNTEGGDSGFDDPAIIQTDPTKEDL